MTEPIRFFLVDKNAGIVDSDTLKKIILETRVAHFAINLSWQDVFFKDHELEIVMFLDDLTLTANGNAKGSLYFRHQDGTKEKKIENA